MDLKDEILKEHSKQNAARLANDIGDDPEKFAALMTLFLGKEYRVTQRAAWTVSHCADQHPQHIRPNIKPILMNLKTLVNVAVIRNMVRLLQYVDIPDDLLGLSTDVFFDLLSSDMPVAIKVHAISNLYKICEKEPSLKNELKVMIEDQMPYQSAAFKSKGGKILKKLKSI